MKVKALFYFFILTLNVTTALSQKSMRWQIDVHSGLSGEITNPQWIDKLPLERFNEDLQGFENTHKNQIGAANFSLAIDVNSHPSKIKKRGA